MTKTNLTVQQLAKVLHHATSALSPGSSTSFDDLDEFRKQLACSAVGKLLTEPARTPEQLHNVWAAPLYADGWMHGEVYSLEHKTHPCLVPYEELPYHEQVKDMLWGTLIELFKTLEVTQL